jgi:hypothetical protein
MFTQSYSILIVSFLDITAARAVAMKSIGETKILGFASTGENKVHAK